MQARLALGIAVACGALAVALVAVDLTYTLTVAIEGQDDNGEWVTYQRQPYDYGADRAHEPSGFGCTGPDVRIVIHNDRPISATRDVRILYDVGGRSTTVLDETVSLDAGEVWTHAFTIPPEAFPDDNETDDRFIDRNVHVNAHVDGLWLSHCASAEGPTTANKEVPA